jgi:hypothetical protein
MCTREQLRGADSEVGVIQRHQIGTLATDDHLELVRVCPSGMYLVVDGDRLIHGGEGVVPIGSRRAHLQCEVDLGRHPHAYAGRTRLRR